MGSIFGAGIWALCFDLMEKFSKFATQFRGVAQPGSVLAWGARGRGFESRHPDLLKA
jgi:hypothetical protein